MHICNWYHVKMSQICIILEEYNVLQRKRCLHIQIFLHIEEESMETLERNEFYASIPLQNNHGNAFSTTWQAMLHFVAACFHVEQSAQLEDNSSCKSSFLVHLHCRLLQLPKLQW
jgi:hypothetical protein